MPAGQPPKRFRKHGDENVHMMSLLGKSFRGKSFLSKGMSSIKKKKSGGRRNSDDMRRSTSIDEERPTIGERNGDLAARDDAKTVDHMV